MHMILLTWSIQCIPNCRFAGEMPLRLIAPTTITIPTCLSELSNTALKAPNLFFLKPIAYSNQKERLLFQCHSLGQYEHSKVGSHFMRDNVQPSLFFSMVLVGKSLLLISSKPDFQ